MDVLIAVITWANTWKLIVLVVYLLALVSVPSVLLKRQGKPQAAMGWLLVLLFIPGLGVLLWWAIGRRHLHRRRKRRRLATEKRAGRLTELSAELPSPPEAQWDLMPIRRLPRDVAEWVYAPTSSNQIDLLVDAAEAYPAMEQAINEAQHHVHALFYIWRNDATGRHFRDLLVAKAKAGVTVRVLLDAVGSSAAGGRFMNPLREAGGQVAVFMRPKLLKLRLDLNFRNHRKIIVADSKVAIVGGLNIGDEYRGAWRDTAIRIRGPAVDQLQDVFADDWHFTTGEDFIHTGYFGGWRTKECTPTIDSPDSASDDSAVCAVVASGPHTEVNVIHDSLFLAICRAEHRIWITTPYFIPDQAILAALRSAVFRGVDVRLLLPDRGDQRLVHMASRSYQPELLRSGVRVFRYQGAFLHGKTLVLDDDLSAVGSANVDIRSFRLNFEVNCYVMSTALAASLTELYEQQCRQAREVTLAEVENRSVVMRLVEAVVHLLSPLL